MSNSKRRFGLLILLAMGFTMLFATSSVFATTTLTSANSSMYHNYAVIQNNGSYQDRNGNTITSFTLDASQAGSYYQPIGFNSENDATNVVWTSSDTSIATVPSHGTAVASVSGTSGTYDSEAVVTLTGTSAGSCSIQASFDGGYVNYTVVLEKSNVSDASNIRVICEDYENSVIWDDTVLNTVSKPSSGSAFYGTGKYAAQTFPSAARAAEEYATELEVSSDGSYIAGINGVGSLTNYTDSWGYGIYRQVNGVWTLQEDTKVIGATDYKLQDGDIVFWFYAPYEQFEDILAGKALELN